MNCNNKKLITLIFLIFISEISYCQVWDFSVQDMYIQSLREMQMRNDQMRPIIYKYYKDASNKYNQGDYKGCYEICNDFLQSYTIYKGQGGIGSPIYAITGKALYKLGERDDSFYLLKLANSHGNREAYDFLNDIFGENERNARFSYSRQDYYNCLNYINQALQTSLSNGDIYITR